MRRHRVAARVALARVAAVVLIGAAVGLPRVTGAPRSTLTDLVVTAGLSALAVLATSTAARVLTGWLWVAAVVWTLTGLTGSLPATLEGPVARLVLVPHAALVLAVAMGQTAGWRLSLPVAFSSVGMLAAGAGSPAPVLVLLGTALVGVAVLSSPALSGRAARRRVPGDARLAGGVLGVGLVLADPHVLGGLLRPALLASLVELLLLGVAVTAAWQAGVLGERRLDLGAAPTGPDELNHWLASRLGVRALHLGFPSRLGVVDAHGVPAVSEAGAVPWLHGHRLVAWVSPSVRVDPALREPLGAMLQQLGDIARLRALCRERADDIATSRARLQAAVDEEGRRLERQLETTIIARLDHVDALLKVSGSPLARRTHEVKDELVRHARGLDPLAGRSLADALSEYRARGTAVDIEPLGRLGGSAARTAWYVAAEGIANATKHAPGAGTWLQVRVEPVGDAGLMHVVVRDDGPGGADRDGCGLLGLADRVAAAGGNLQVDSGPDGTTLTAVLPIERPGTAPEQGSALDSAGRVG